MKTCHNCKYYREGITKEERRQWSWSNTGRWARGMCFRKFDFEAVPHPVIPSQTFPGCGGAAKGWEAKDMEQISFSEAMER